MRARSLLHAIAAAALVALVGSPPAQSQDSPFSKGKGFGSKGSSKAGDLKKYDDVITKEFKTQPGVFAVHRDEDKVYFEIPQDKIGRLFMWYAEVAKGPG